MDDKASLDSTLLVNSCDQIVFAISADPVRMDLRGTVIEPVERPITKIELKELPPHWNMHF